MLIHSAIALQIHAATRQSTHHWHNRMHPPDRELSQRVPISELIVKRDDTLLVDNQILGHHV